MTPPEKTVWLAAYAAAWIHAPDRFIDPEHESKDRATWSARQACGAVEALRAHANPELRLHSSNMAIEALKW